MVSITLVAIECRRCLEHFILCLRCYHGEAYCSEDCRKLAREEQVQRARADYLQRLGEEAVREDNRLRKQRSRESRNQKTEGVTDQTTSDQSQVVGNEDVDSGSQGTNVTTKQDSRRVQDETSKTPHPTLNGAGVIKTAIGRTEQELGATVDNAQPAPTIKQEAACVAPKLQQEAPPGGFSARCSCCGVQGRLVPWVLFAKARQRSFRRLLASRRK